MQVIVSYKSIMLDCLRSLKESDPNILFEITANKPSILNSLVRKIKKTREGQTVDLTRHEAFVLGESLREHSVYLEELPQWSDRFIKSIDLNLKPWSKLQGLGLSEPAIDEVLEGVDHSRLGPDV